MIVHIFIWIRLEIQVACIDMIEFLMHLLQEMSIMLKFQRAKVTKNIGYTSMMMKYLKAKDMQPPMPFNFVSSKPATPTNPLRVDEPEVEHPRSSLPHTGPRYNPPPPPPPPQNNDVFSSNLKTFFGM